MKQRYVILSRGNEADIRGNEADILRAPIVGRGANGGVFRLPLSVEELDDAEAQDLNDDPTVRSLAPADVPLALMVPMDGNAEDVAAPPWGLAAVGVPTSPRTGKGVRVAVLDTGLKRDHEAFSALLAGQKIIVHNFTDGEPDDVTDTDGHGTHCAGTIAGGMVGGQPIGVAPGIDCLIVGKVLGPGGGSNEKVVEAIQWAAEQKANIVSMSLGIDFPLLVERLNKEYDIPLQAATSMALKQYRDTVSLFGKLADFLSFRNVLLVAATGNESKRPAYTIDVAPPAASEHILKIGALSKSPDGSFAIARFSNTGPDLVAPGADILSASIKGGLHSLSGTSMATPHVAGVAALWAEQLLALNGNVSFQDIKAEMWASAQRLNGRRVDMGRGLVRAPQT